MCHSEEAKYLSTLGLSSSTLSLSLSLSLMLRFWIARWPFAVLVLMACIALFSASIAKVCPKHVRARTPDGCRSSWLDPCSEGTSPVCCSTADGALTTTAPCYLLMSSMHALTGPAAWLLPLLPLLPALLPELLHHALARRRSRSGGAATAGVFGGVLCGPAAKRLALYLAIMVWRVAVYSACQHVLAPLLRLLPPQMGLRGPTTCWYQGRWGLGQSRCKAGEFALSDHLVLFIAHYFPVLAHEWTACAAPLRATTEVAAAALEPALSAITVGARRMPVLLARASVVVCGGACIYQLYFTARFFHTTMECVSALLIGVGAVDVFTRLVSGACCRGQRGDCALCVCQCRAFPTRHIYDSQLTPSCFPIPSGKERPCLPCHPCCRCCPWAKVPLTDRQARRRCSD